jgi:XTP/dITP diphosphohydrolase
VSRESWIIATRSAGKLKELVPMLASHGIVGVGLDAAGVPVDAVEDAIEVHDSFTENALAKARYFAALTGRPCLADDSGLCVDALQGLPGVRSRRFAADRGLPVTDAGDEDTRNNDALVNACWDSGFAPPWAAHYACVMALVGGAVECVGEGRTEGVIQPERTGQGGFGYDPYFVSRDLGQSFAVASREEKARVSHRARALVALLARVGTLGPA